MIKTMALGLVLGLFALGLTGQDANKGTGDNTVKPPCGNKAQGCKDKKGPGCKDGKCDKTKCEQKKDRKCGGGPCAK